ncbi:MAG: hypothetical protein AAF632_11235 [Bacteroidota bacterium]
MASFIVCGQYRAVFINESYCETIVLQINLGETIARSTKPGDVVASSLSHFGTYPRD